MKEHDVFISYKSDESGTADWVRSVLETNGITCWMAPADIPGGSSYAVEIPQAISTCRVFVVVLSRKAQASTWVPKELDLAVNAGKVVMPFMTENFQLRDDFNFYLSNVQRYAAYENKSRAMEKMVREIRAVLDADSQEGGKPAQPPVPSAVPEKNGKKRILTGCLAGLLALCLLAAGWFFLRPLISPPAEPAETAGQGESRVVQAEGDRYHVTLEPSGNQSVKNLKAAKQILRERLDLFMEGYEYQWIGDGDKETIDLFLPREAFAGKSLDYVLNAYLIRAVKLYAQNGKNGREYIPMERSDLESVTLQSGSIPDVDASEYGIQEEEYPYIVITLSDGFIEKHRAEYESWSEFRFTQDYEETRTGSIYSYYTFPAGDSKTFYVLNNDTDSRFSSVLVYNLTHDSLSEAFSCTVDLNSSARWEDPEAVEDNGKNQAGADSFDTGTVTFAIATGKLESGSFLNAENALKARMDALGIPYAVGISGKNTAEARIVIKSPLEHMGIPVMEMLAFKGSATVRSGFMSQYLSLADLSVSKAKTADGAYAIETASTTHREGLKAMAAAALEEGKTAIWLYMDKNPILACDAAAAAASGELLVSGLCAFEDGMIRVIPVTESNSWYVQLIRAVIETRKLADNLRLDTRQMNAAPDGTLPKASDYEVSEWAECGKIEQAVREIHPDAEVNCTNGDLHIFLGLPLDSAFPGKALDLGQKIFERLEKENLDVSGIMILPADEDSDTAERSRLYFYKEYSYAVTDADGVTAYNGGRYVLIALFQGGRIDAYREEINELLTQSDFYQQHLILF